MNLDIVKKIKRNKSLQYAIGVGSIFFISFVCFLFIDIIGYHVVALILLLAVSLLAIFFDILPILVVAVLSALIWNFFFIQPRSTFNISTPQDALLFLMYFVIVVINAVFTTKIRRMESIARKKEEREKTLQLYNSLLNSLSHELKTPISTVIGAVETLRMASSRVSEKNKEELFSEIHIAGHRLHRQVNNLLSMSRLESDSVILQKDWYDINEMIHSVIQNNQCDDETRILFETSPDLPLFRLDGILMEQIIQNIVHNALQYTPKGTQIKIQARAIEKHLHIQISDKGPGFPEDKISLVFDKFYRLPETSPGGTGLGLSIAQGFAKALKGSIVLENIPTGGASFTVSIPAEITSINIYET